MWFLRVSINLRSEATGGSIDCYYQHSGCYWERKRERDKQIANVAIIPALEAIHIAQSGTFGLFRALIGTFVTKFYCMHVSHGMIHASVSQNVPFAESPANIFMWLWIGSLSLSSLLTSRNFVQISHDCWDFNECVAVSVQSSASSE